MLMQQCLKQNMQKKSAHRYVIQRSLLWLWCMLAGDGMFKWTQRKRMHNLKLNGWLPFFFANWCLVNLIWDFKTMNVILEWFISKMLAKLFILNELWKNDCYYWWSAKYNYSFLFYVLELDIPSRQFFCALSETIQKLINQSFKIFS